jgi:hypothetical protein
MSPIARALADRFEEVCRLELVRLQKKTAALSPADRTEVEAMCVEVTRAISSQLAAAAEIGGHANLHDVLGRLFAVAAPHGPAAFNECRAPGSGGALSGEEP